MIYRFVVMLRVFILFMLLITGCHTKTDKANINSPTFQLPVVVVQNQPDSVEPWKADGINDVYPMFIGQYTFRDSLVIDGGREKRRIDEKEARWEENVYAFDTLSSDGLQIYTDYDRTIVLKVFPDDTKGNAFFPVYIVNETRQQKLFVAKDRRVFAIQEALDTGIYGHWYAIEAEGFDFCGNGYFRRRMNPGEFILFLMPKYSGSQTTFLRTRILIGESVIITKPYKGSFGKEQFRLRKHYIHRKEIEQLGHRWMFYGAKLKRSP